MFVMSKDRNALVNADKCDYFSCDSKKRKIYANVNSVEQIELGEYDSKNDAEEAFCKLFDAIDDVHLM